LEGPDIKKEFSAEEVECVRWAMVGAGAMGSLFGGLLGRAGQEVWLVDGWREQVDALNGGGLRIEDHSGCLGQGEIVVRVAATTDPGEVEPVDCVVFFVKSYDTEAAARWARPLFGPETVALTLQNGLGNVEQLERVLGSGRVLAGATSCGATLLGPGRIRFAGCGPTTVGELEDRVTPRVERIAAALAAAGLPTEVSANIKSVIWGKILINVGINALTALTGLTNGGLLEHAETREVMRAAVTEATTVALARNIRGLRSDPVAHVEEVAARTAANRSSMLQDVERGRRTEIEAINGSIVREAAVAGLSAPVNMVLTALVKMKEKSYTG
jgi:2-dehydropantoate 2-reductase